MGLMRYSTAIGALAAALAMAPMAAAQTAAGQLPAAAPQAPRPTQQNFQLQEGIILTVNDQIVTGHDFRQRMLLMIALSGVQPTPENMPAIQQEALNALIDERLQARELVRWELQVKDEDIDAELAAMAAEAGTDAAGFIRILNEGGIETRTLRNYLQIAIGWRDLVGGRFYNRARPSRSQVEQAIRQDTENASRRRYRIGEIYIDASRVGGMQQAVNGAQQLVQQMIQGAPFQAVARQFSAAPSATRDGEAGWVVEGAVHPALQQAFDNLEVGQLSNPIVVEGGVYIIYMIDKQDGSAAEMVSLRQVMIELPATATDAEVEAASLRLTGLRGELSCETILPRARTEDGLLGSDLGEADIRNLLPTFQTFAREGEIGAISEPVRSPLGVHLLALCGRRIGGPEAPTYQAVEARLQRANLAMLGRRYIRDLREDALIEYKE